jgi:hypothetical protein
MTLELIEPDKIQITGALPQSCLITQCYYLGYGRNAWQSTWINRYYPHSVSFDPQKLRMDAEQHRIQGSVFKLESIPLLILKYRQNAFGIAPINDRSKADYKEHFDVIIRNLPQYFWLALPPSKSNWILVFTLPQSRPDVT